MHVQVNKTAGRPFTVTLIAEHDHERHSLDKLNAALRSGDPRLELHSHVEDSLGVDRVMFKSVATRKRDKR